MPYGNDSLGFLSRNSSNNSGRRYGSQSGSGGFGGGFGGSPGGSGAFGGGSGAFGGGYNPFQVNFARETYQTAISDLRDRREQGELGLDTTRFQNQSLADLNKFRGGLFNKIRGNNYKTGGPIGTNASGAPSFADLFRSKLSADLLRSLVG